MDFLKSLLLVILVPLVVSSFTFASKRGSENEMLRGMSDTQGTILTELKDVRTNINTIKTNQDVGTSTMNNIAKEVNRQGELLNDVDKEVVRVKTNLKNIENNIIKGGPERLKRLEDMFFQQ